MYGVHGKHLDNAWGPFTQTAPPGTDLSVDEQLQFQANQPSVA